MKTYLVTGGAGFIGANYIRYLFHTYGKEVKVINYDKLTYAANTDHLSGLTNWLESKNYEFVEGDICDEHKIMKLLVDKPVDYIVHFAAETHVDHSLEDAAEFVKTNVYGTMNLLQCVKKVWGKEYKGRCFQYVSTDEVYGELPESGYFVEEMPLAPRNPYSASKAGAEHLVLAFASSFQLPVHITRCSNNYGPYQHSEKLIPKCIMNCLHYKKIPVYGDGRNIRDWLYVKDHCKALEMVLHLGKQGEIYNIGGHNEVKAVEIVRFIIAYIREKYDNKVNEDLIEFVKDREGHDKRYAIDASKISNSLHWIPDTRLEEGLCSTIDWYVNKYQNASKKY